MILIVGLIAVFVSRSDLRIRIGGELSMLISESTERKKNRRKGGPREELQRSLQRSLHATTAFTMAERLYRLPQSQGTTERNYIYKRRTY